MPDPETLEQFVERVKQELGDFEKNWRDNHSVAPKSWPMTMSSGDWDDQFSSHLSI